MSFMRTVWMILLAAVSAGSVLAQPAGREDRDGSPGIERLLRMSPEERSKALEGLPPWRRKRLEERLERYNQLSPEARQLIHERYEAFRKLPPQEQKAVRDLFRRLSEVPPRRRVELRWQARRMSRMTPERRQLRMAHPWFKERYTSAERELIADMIRLLPLAK